MKKYSACKEIILFQMTIALLMIIPGDIGSLIDFFSFTSWFFYGMTVVALLYLRFKDRDAKRPYKVNILYSQQKEKQTMWNRLTLKKITGVRPV